MNPYKFFTAKTLRLEKIHTSAHRQWIKTKLKTWSLSSQNLWMINGVSLNLCYSIIAYTYHSLHKWCWTRYWILHITMGLLVLKTTNNNKILCLIPFKVAKSWSSDLLISKFRMHIACWDRSVSCTFQQEWQLVLLKTKLFKNKEKASYKLLCRPP